jgi:hypothetical protein
MRNLVYYLVVLSFFLQGCNFGRGKAIKRINDNYSEEAINYLYEVAFHDSEFPKKDKNLWKWEKDISFFIDGDTLPGDKQSILSAINEINALNLPITINEKACRDSADFFFLFTSGKPRDELGSTKINIINNYIDSVKIEIFYDPHDSLTFGIRRRATILHEMMHALGLPGHSNNYSNGVLILGFTNYTCKLTDLDKQVINLLYESALPAGYACKQFEYDFADVLYHIANVEKVSSLIKKGILKKKSLEYIYKYGLTKSKNQAQEECIVKFSLPVVVRVKGDYTSEITDQIKKAINEINKATNKLSLVYAQGETLLPDAGVYFAFKRDSSMEYSVQSQIQNTSYFNLRFPYLIKSEIQIDFKNVQKMQMVIANSLYHSVCLQSDTSNCYLFEKDNLHLMPVYSEILKDYYNPFLTSGLTKNDLENILDRFTKINKERSD